MANRNVFDKQRETLRTSGINRVSMQNDRPKQKLDYGPAARNSDRRCDLDSKGHKSDRSSRSCDRTPTVFSGMQAAYSDCFKLGAESVQKMTSAIGRMFGF